MTLTRSLLKTTILALVFSLALTFALSYGLQDAHAATIQPNAINQQPRETGKEVPFEQKLQFATGAEWIFEGLKAIGSFFAWIGGYLFDISLSWFVMDMKGTAEWLGLTDVITEIWRMVRDLFNLLFIFGIILAGFKLILGVDDSNAKRSLRNIIIAALLINFSLFAAQIVVDFSNILTSEMSQLLKSPSENQTNTAQAKVLDKEVTNIADSFIGAMDPTKIMNSSSIEAIQNAINKKQPSIDYTTNDPPEINIGMALIMGITSAFTLTLVGFVFAAGAFLMFARFLYLMFLMMFSPVMFLGMVLPNFKGKSKDWVETLFKQALMGPAYLFMLYIALKALATIKGINYESSVISYVMLSLIVCGFVWAALMVSKSMGTYGASQIMSMGQSMGRSARGYVGRAAGGTTFGLGARGLRATAGRLSNKVANIESLKDTEAKGGLRGWAARRTLNLAQKGADSSFDARKIGGLGNKLNIGQGVSGGYKTLSEKITKEGKERAENLGVIPDTDDNVASLIAKAGQTEKEIKYKRTAISELEKSKRGKSPDEIIKIQADIDAHKEELSTLSEDHEKQKESVKREKYRRQLGDPSKVGVFTQQLIATQKNDVNSKLIAYANERAQPTPDVKKLNQLKTDIATAKRNLAETEKLANKRAGGYAATVSGPTSGISGLIKRIILGKNKTQITEVANQIRGEYMKKIKVKDA